MNRRQFVGAALGAAEIDREGIYRLLGFTTMNGEDPLRLWARLKKTSVWLSGPLAPDCWAGQTFIADHADIFAFRFLSAPAAWMAAVSPDKLAAHGASVIEARFRANQWRQWWKRVGPRAWDDSYARLVWQMPDGGPEVTYEWVQTAPNEVVARITHNIEADVIIQGYVPWDSAPPKFSVLYSGDAGQSFLLGRSWVPGTRDGMRWVLAVSAQFEDTSGSGSPRWHGIIRKVKTLYLCARQGQSYPELREATNSRLGGGRIDGLLSDNLRKYLAARPAGTKWLSDAPPAVNDQLQWSEVYTPQRKRRYITVSRSWARDNNSAPDFLWDSFLNAVLVAQEDERKAYDMLLDITAWQNDQGMFVQYGEWPPRPNLRVFPVAWGHTQFPLGALAAAKVYARRPRRDLLAVLYPRLLKNHQWWFRDRGDGQPWRDGNRNGLLELGSNYPEEIPYADRQQVAYFESYDDSPQWWGTARYNEKTGTLEQDTVERNCLYAMDCWILAWLADRLGRTADAARLRTEHQQMAGRINKLLWDPGKACYYNRKWGEAGWFPHVSPDIYFSLLAQVADEERAAALRKMFHDPGKFAGEWLLPTISRDDPEYPKQDYWKGKVWAPVNWLVYQGFKIYEWDLEARLLAESSMKMFMKPWREDARCHENFLATTGEGSSDPRYSWGALMPLIGIEEWIDANPWHGLRFGNVQPVAEGGIERYPVAGALYDVQLSDAGLEVNRNGKRLIAASRAVEVRQVRLIEGKVHCEIRTPTPATIWAGDGPAREIPAGISRLP